MKPSALDVDRDLGHANVYAHHGAEDGEHEIPSREQCTSQSGVLSTDRPRLPSREYLAHLVVNTSRSSVPVNRFPLEYTPPSEHARSRYINDDIRGTA